jgi:predicted nucleotidyltransferase
VAVQHDPFMHEAPPIAPELDGILDRLREVLPELRGRYPLGSVSVFGSRARGTAGPDSDLDLLVDWSGPASLLDYAGLRLDLEERMGLRVQLTNRRLLKAALAPTILSEAVPV